VEALRDGLDLALLVAQVRGDHRVVGVEREPLDGELCQHVGALLLNRSNGSSLHNAPD